MIPFAVNYATPSSFESTRERAMLALAADRARPVKFDAKIVDGALSLRVALQALGQLVWAIDEWGGNDEAGSSLDPVVTVHQDRVFFEAFSNDQSAYGLVIVDPRVFQTTGEVRYGTTNVDFTAWLWAALAEMRSSRETHVRIGTEGLEVSTSGAGGRFEQKVEIPEEWVRGFVQLQAAMAMPGTRFTARPVDLLAAIRILRFTKAKVSPRAMRYEFEPGRDVKLVLEPWEREVPLRGATHAYPERCVFRTWGRRRLKLLEPLLPYADRVDVYLRGRAMPSFYAVKLPFVTFVLGLSGWTAQHWAKGGGFASIASPEDDRELASRVVALLRERHAAKPAEVAEKLGVPVPTATRSLVALCAAGRCLYDLETSAYRHRELFATEIDLARVYPPDARRERADRFIAENAVEIVSSLPRETRKTKRFATPDGPEFREVIHRDWVVTGRVGDQKEVEIVLNDEDRLIFARCGCSHFRETLLTQGPCEHIGALLLVARPQRADAPSSIASSREEYTSSRAETEAAKASGRDDDESAVDDEEGTDDDA